MLEKNGVFYASDFNGKNGGEKIQNAIDYSVKKVGKGQKVIVVPPEGPDKNKRWVLKNSIKLPSNTTLFLNNCYIFLDNNAKDNLITNQNHKKGNKNIHIIGNGKPILDGNASNQGRKERFDRSQFMLGIHLVKVKNFSIKNIEIGPTTAWGICPEDVENGEIENIFFSHDGKQPNQDGIDFPGPARNIIIKNIYGNTGDDSIALNAFDHRLEGGFTEFSGGDIENITIENVQTRVVESGNNIRLLCGDGRKIRNIRIAGVNCLPGSKANSLIVFGNAGRYTQKLPEPEDFTDIYVSDIHRHTEDKKILIWIDSPVGNLMFSNISAGGKCEKVITIEKNNTVETLNINNFMVSGESKNVLEIDGIVKNLFFSNGTVDKVECFLSGEGEIRNGVIKDVLISKCSKFISFKGKINCNFVNLRFSRGG